MNQKKQVLLGWIIAFGIGYMTSSKAGQFLTENLNNKITFVIFDVNFILFFAQFMVIFICYWGIKINSRIFNERDNVHDEEKALIYKKVYKKFLLHIYFLYVVGTILSGTVIIMNYNAFGQLIAVIFLIFSLAGFVAIYNEAQFRYSEMKFNNLIKKILNLDEKNLQMMTVISLMWIIVFLAVCLLRHPTFAIGEEIKKCYRKNNSIV